MKFRVLLLSILYVAFAAPLRCQESSSGILFLEAGIDGIGCDAPHNEYIRSAADPNLQYYASEIHSLMMLDYLGLKFEYRLFGNLLGVSGGLRYSRMNTSIGKSSYFDATPDYFYVNFSSSEQVTEYARVREINQKGDYIGVPFELRLYPKNEHRFKLYYKAGVSFNLKVHSESDIVFHNKSMDSYEQEVQKVIEKVTPSFTSFHFGLGLKIGKSNKPGFSVETYTPVGVVFPKGSYLVHPLAGSGIQFMLSIPLITNEQ